jgi:uncharacterized protein (DUF488 family)
MARFDLFTIGHSNIPAERFTAMLQSAGADAVADVRSVPASRFCPWFSAKNLAPVLATANIDYLFFGNELGGRPRDRSLYRHGVADYEAMARQVDFQSGLDRVLAHAGRHCLCLMCSEREPLDCHRCLLVGRALAARGVTIGHVLHDGAIEAHAGTERRLLEAASADSDLFATGQDERLAAAYRRRARAVAYRLKGAIETKSGPTVVNKKSRTHKSR